MAKLLVQESNGSREFDLVDVELSIGRELDNSLRLADPSISRHHAVIRQAQNGHEIQDLGSSNGVLINGNRVQSAQLQDGDRITLGQLQLTYVSPAPVPVPENPLGTMRMSLEEMNKLQAAANEVVPPQPDPSLATTNEALALPPMPAPLAPLSPAPTSAPKPWPPQITVAASNPAPAFLRPYLPPVPDDAQPVTYANAVVRGEFGARFLALLIDSLIGSALFLAFTMGSAVLGFITSGLGCLTFLFYPLVTIGYLVFTLWCTVQFRATIGKKIMKLRIVPEDNPNGNIDWGMALLRFLGHAVSSFACSLPYLLILGAERKGLQDMFSQSIVIKVDR